MRALAIDRYGKDAPLTLRDIPVPKAGAGEVLIEVHAASVNPVDFKTRDGKLKQIQKFDFPLVLGLDLSGVVRELGEGVTAWKPGDEVIVRLDRHRSGAFADFVVAGAAVLARKPSNLSHVEAASLPLAGLTAYQALVELGKLERGQSVLIHGGAGGVGTLAIQLAKHLGAKVFTTASSRNHELVKGLGADVAIDYHAQRFEEVARSVDLVFDTIGGDTLLRSFACVKQGGRVVSIAAMPDEPTARAQELGAAIRFVLRFLNRKVTAAANRAGAEYRYLLMHPDGAQLAELARLAEEGTLRPVVERTFPLERGADALAEVERGHARGKIVIQVR